MLLPEPVMVIKMVIPPPPPPLPPQPSRSVPLALSTSVGAAPRRSPALGTLAWTARTARTLSWPASGTRLAAAQRYVAASLFLLLFVCLPQLTLPKAANQAILYWFTKPGSADGRFNLVRARDKCFVPLAACDGGYGGTEVYYHPHDRSHLKKQTTQPLAAASIPSHLKGCRASIYPSSSSQNKDGSGDQAANNNKGAAGVEKMKQGFSFDDMLAKPGTSRAAVEEMRSAVALFRRCIGWGKQSGQPWWPCYDVTASFASGSVQGHDRVGSPSPGEVVVSWYVVSLLSMFALN